MKPSSLDGTTSPRFAGVRDAFAEGFASFPELGAALCVVVQGTTVVDLWGGYLDAATTRPWQRDSLVNVFSATKGIVATLVHRLASKGRLELDARVSSYWPEFASANKEDLSLRSLLDHSAGLPAVRAPLPVGTLYDWTAMTRALAAEAPWWEPGTAHGYHAVTFGFLVGEVLRRATGRTTGELVRDELAQPFGLDLHIGLAERDFGRVAELPPTIVPDAAANNPVAQAMTDPTSLTGLAFGNPADLTEPGVANTAKWRRAEIPASNGHATARSMGRLYGALANRGVLATGTVMPQSAITQATIEHRRGLDRVLNAETAFSAGYMLPSELRPFGQSSTCFGHSGAGGALGFADPHAGIGFAYTPNQTIASMNGGDPRWVPLIDAVYQCLN
jgi:CubicO group peptidase (beta-lactamase class C family)